MRHLVIALCLSFLHATAVFAEAPSCNAIFLPNIQTNKAGAQFLLQRKQPDHTAFQVERAAKLHKLKTGVSLTKPVDKILAWLDRYEGWLKKNKDKPRARALLLEAIYNEYIVKKEDIPEAYYELQRQIYRETGRGDLQLTQEHRDYLAEVAIADQKHSLKIWFDHLFFSPETSNTPIWVKSWAFQGLTKLGKYEFENGTFTNRSKGQTAPFPSLNKEALAKTLSMMVSKVDNQSSLKITDPVLKENINGANFSKIFGRSIYLEINSKLETLSVEGRWVKYNQGSDPKILSESLSCKNTGWCTEQPNTAAQQLHSGDFYVYFSNNEKGLATEPRIAIRMDGDRIGEIRGIAENQNLDSKISKTDILDRKLKEFGTEGLFYLKRDKDMKMLTLLEQKYLKKIPLTAEDIIFLYEIEGPIMGFGTSKDPRIEALSSQRNIKEDLAFAYGIKMENISTTKEEFLSSPSDIYIHLGELALDVSDFSSLKSIRIPKVIVGDLFLTGFTSVEGLKFPKILNGSLDLGDLTSTRGLELPENINGSLYLGGLSSARGLRLPHTLNGNIDFSGLKSSQYLKLPKNLTGKVILGSLTSAKGMELPSEQSDYKLVLSKSAYKTLGQELPNRVEFVEDGLSY